MRNPSRLRSFYAQATIWVVLPLLLIILGIIAAGVFTYQRSLSTLILSRHGQMARLAAVSVSQVIDGYADLLAALASKQEIQSESEEIQKAALEETREALGVFNAGLLVVDEQGDVRAASSNDLAFLGTNVAGLDVWQNVQQNLSPSYGNVLINENTGEAFVLIAVPIISNDLNAFNGALIGGLNLESASLSEPVRRLTIGFNGYAYLVDQNGIVISHPDAGEIGQDYSDRPFVRNVIEGREGETVWDSPDDGRDVGANALVSTSGWGLVVKEPWASVTDPIRFYGLFVGILGSAVLLGTLILLWNGVQRVITPVKSLSKQTALLASEEPIEPIASSGIEEIDTLEQAFLRMAEQIDTYRSGLRKYVEAITQSQEDERRRISRELHDETIQNLLSIQRRLEWYQEIVENREQQAQLAELQEIVRITLEGVGQISKDLRPLMLEDLGLIPALQGLVRSAHQGINAIPHTKFKVSGEPYPLRPDQELALYRITQEALANVKKHARATGVFVELCFYPTMVTLEINDDGIGFEAPNSFAALTRLDSFGLMGIQERVWAAGGNLSIDSAPGKGTQLRVSFPVEKG